MQIVYFPHPALRFKSADIRQIDNNLRTVVRRMFELMYEANGIGLAANQIGLPLRVFVMNLAADPEETDQEFVFINPQITNRKGSDVAEEGCLSIPKLYADVRRPSDVQIEAFDLDGQLFEMSLDDLPARVVQHELDHLDGVMFTDKVIESQRKDVEPVLNVFEETLRQAQAAKAYLSDDELLNTLREIAAAGGVPGSFLEETVAPPQADVPASLLRARKGRGEAE
ncbi:MAG: peptide deformylase [Planctomycetaceae bacterium]|nr:peptide deformylase [Planctomycetaceae bacterium]